MDNCNIGVCPQHAKNDFRIGSLEERIKEYAENQIEIVKGLHEVRERVTKTEESTKSAHHRLDEMTEQTKAIIRMSISVEHVAEKMNDVLTILKEHSDRMDDQDDKIDTLKQAPAQTVFEYWKLFVGALVTGGAGVILGLLIKGVQ